MAAQATINPDSADGLEFRNEVKAFISDRSPQIILAGPADTSKTYAACTKAFLIAARYPGVQGAIIRKVAAALYGSVLQTFERLTKGFPIEAYGGEKVEHYKFWNGSRIWVGGMDKPEKVLSSERDFIYCNQTEELVVGDWELLGTRCTGRAAKMPYAQLMGDCNPSGSRHWIRQKAQAGTIKMFTATHKDNPELFTQDGVITDEGKRRIGALESNLTGVRRKRLLEGIWATAEGAVYDMFDAALHVVVRDPKDMKRWFLAMDEGYTNPAVILLVGMDSDGRTHTFKEFYMRGVLQEDVVAKAWQWHGDAKCELAAVDESAAGLIADLRRYGLHVIAGKGRVKDGIDKIANRLKVAGDGRPRETVDPSCVNTINEYESYRWKPEKDEPVKEDDHAMDARRYLEDALDRPAPFCVVA